MSKLDAMTKAELVNEIERLQAQVDGLETDLANSRAALRAHKYRAKKQAKEQTNGGR